MIGWVSIAFIVWCIAVASCTVERHFEWEFDTEVYFMVGADFLIDSNNYLETRVTVRVF
jgi:hypothetical protein